MKGGVIIGEKSDTEWLKILLDATDVSSCFTSDAGERQFWPENLRPLGVCLIINAKY